MFCLMVAWNALHNLKTKIKLRLEPKHKYNVIFVVLVIVDCIWQEPVSIYAINVLHWWLR